MNSLFPHFPQSWQSISSRGKQIEFAIKNTSAYQKLSPKSDTGDLICTSLAWSFPVTHRLQQFAGQTPHL